MLPSLVIVSIVVISISCVHAESVSFKRPGGSPTLPKLTRVKGRSVNRNTSVSNSTLGETPYCQPFSFPANNQSCQIRFDIFSLGTCKSALVTNVPNQNVEVSYLCNQNDNLYYYVCLSNDGCHNTTCYNDDFNTVHYESDASWQGTSDDIEGGNLWLSITSDNNVESGYLTCSISAQCNSQYECPDCTTPPCATPTPPPSPAPPSPPIPCSSHGTLANGGASPGVCDCDTGWLGSNCAIAEDTKRATEFSVLLISSGVVFVAVVWVTTACAKSHKTYVVVSNEIRAKQLAWSSVNMASMIVLPFQAVQVISFAFAPGLPTWSASKIAAFLRSFMLDWDINIFLYLFWASVGIVSVWGLLWFLLYCRFRHTNKEWKPQELSSVDSCLLMVSTAVFPLVGNLLFLPLVVTLLSTFACSYPKEAPSFNQSDSGILCWKAQHWQMVGLALASLLLYIPQTVRSQRLWQEYVVAYDQLNLNGGKESLSNTPELSDSKTFAPANSLSYERQAHKASHETDVIQPDYRPVRVVVFRHRYKQVLLLFKFMIALTSISLHTNAVFCVLVMASMQLAFFVFHVYSQPCNVREINLVQSLFFGMAFWSSAVSAIALGTSAFHSHEDAVTAVLLGGWAVMLLGTCTALRCTTRSEELLQKKKNQMKDKKRALLAEFVQDM